MKLKISKCFALHQVISMSDIFRTTKTNPKLLKSYTHFRGYEREVKF